MVAFKWRHIKVLIFLNNVSGVKQYVILRESTLQSTQWREGGSQIILWCYKRINYRQTLFHIGIAVLEDAHTHTPSEMDSKVQKKWFFNLYQFIITSHFQLFSFFISHSFSVWRWNTTILSWSQIRLHVWMFKRYPLKYLNQQ